MTRRFETLDDWLDWQASLHPKTIELGLARVAAVWKRLGPTPPPFPVITVGGTNGKGSCVAMIESMAEAAGYRCACYTSPHLLRYNERVRIAGEPVSDESLCDAFARVDRARGDTTLTYFEFGTLAALDLFVRYGPDLAVLEVGLGGRLDAVNLLDADVSVVTSIGRDHTAWLGETLDAIAVEKAGIFRAGRPAVMGQRDAPVRLREEAVRLAAAPLQLGREIDHETADNGWIWKGAGGERLALPLPTLRGAFQLNNAAAAIAALACLRERLPVPVNALRAGLQRARLAGRFQVIPGAPTWILDVAHNGAAAQALATNLRAFACPGQLRAVLAVLSDKEPEAIAKPLLPFVAQWFLTQSDDPRAMPADRLAARLDTVLGASSGGCFAETEHALDAALSASDPGDCLLVVGSFTTVSQALRRFRGGNRDER
ncbi:bifunctional tetrahydrofolate synthase/dihydrofolate synthase [Thiocystis violascens]|uniref:Dihydrofolate synthase/folylpolyglutamate synthase n=1 Tax=Thiocystis violascens (strain ATCC 17096 / DSM 198 / 6111) TaxID=765911 RepID=I3Y7I1_THIV6|nr:bifunctional tetrahydrofolate synthase/dihydrofolate synthase [Thiocystis violascens]AFL72949.1 folylpolyglutamate synthase/dihydrofolate synthase [Thiocystis violascens DSM 198]